jgi:hypothetical protein
LVAARSRHLNADIIAMVNKLHSRDCFRRGNSTKQYLNRPRTPMIKRLVENNPNGLKLQPVRRFLANNSPAIAVIV